MKIFPFIPLFTAQNMRNLQMQAGWMVLFGVLLALFPTQTAMFLTMAFGFFLLVNGIVTLFAGFRGSIAVGVVVLLIGGFFLFRPGFADVAAMVLLGGFLAGTGVLQFLAATRIKQAGVPVAEVVLSALFSFVLGILFVVAPFAGLQALMIVIGVLLAIFGIAELALFRQIAKGLAATQTADATTLKNVTPDSESR
ncbi:MAG: DUF308 domain-containing protein [Victivallaceae bacterium]|nr:DUF308 domain-containing protein [Victivallaceae bacterium]